MQAFDLTSPEICVALRRARMNKVRVKVLVDKRSESSECLATLEKRHIPVFISEEGGFAHNKIIIIDSAIVITGSYNYTEHAKQNEENFLVIHDHAIAIQYIDNWWGREDNSRYPEK